MINTAKVREEMLEGIDDSMMFMLLDEIDRLNAIIRELEEDAVRKP